MGKLDLTIIICTYNRADILNLALKSISKILKPYTGYEFIIVDNNSTDHTKAIVEQRVEINPQYVIEINQGLSYSRNTGLRLSSRSWVLYLDDDIQLEEDIFKRIQDLQAKPHLDIVGGIYRPWYHYEKPVWYKDAYATNDLGYTDLILLPTDKYISGGIMLFRKSVFADSEGFRVDLGMKGESVGFGEETELQIRMRNRGIDIYYDPRLTINHIVQQYKYSVRWHIEAAYLRGKASASSKLYGGWRGNAVIQLILMLGQFATSLVRNSIKLALQKDFYKENFLLETFRKPVKRLGAAMYYMGL